MKIKSSEFLISNTDYNLCPKDNIPEYAFIGRSNVGKSSLINLLVNKKNLAKTSGKPGKTKFINHYKVNDKWFLVDLPGYGYAISSKKKRQEFKNMIFEYLSYRKNLICLFVLIDIRHQAQKIDLEFIRMLADIEMPFVIVFTKSDKISKTEGNKNIKSFSDEMLKDWEYLPEFFITSSKKNIGRKEILKFIEIHNSKFIFSLN